MARLNERSCRGEVVKVKVNAGMALLDDLNEELQGIWRSVAGARKAFVPVAFAVVLILAATLGFSHYFAPSSALASTCTLSILNGSVNVQPPAAGGTAFVFPPKSE